MVLLIARHSSQQIEEGNLPMKWTPFSLGMRGLSYKHCLYEFASFW